MINQMAVPNVHTAIIIMICRVNHFVCAFFYLVILSNIVFFPSARLIRTRKH